MKKIALTLILIGFILQSLQAKTVISFKADGGNIVIDHPQATYPLPITLKFPVGLLAGKHKISVYDQDKVSQLAPNIAVTGLVNQNGFYQLNIGGDLILDACNCKLKPAFFLKIDGVLITTAVNTKSQVQPPMPGASIAGTPDYGYPFYDAITLSKLTVVNDPAMIQNILQFYKLTKPEQLQANPFLKIELAGLFDQPGLNGGSLPITAALQSAGDLDVTSIADGLAKFIVARMKEELSTAFFSKFKKELESTPEGKKFQVLFPTTYKALQTIDQQVYNYSAYLDLLRESFQKDLVLLVPDLQKLIDDPDFLSGYPEVKTALSDAAYIANAFNGGAHPGDVLNDYITQKANTADLGKINPNIYPSLQTLNLLSQSLRSRFGNNYWVSGDSLKMIFKDEATVRLYFGLLYQNILEQPGGDILFNGKSLKDYLGTFANDINNLESIYKPFLTVVASKAKAVDTYFQSVKKASSYAKNQPDYQDYYGLVTTAGDLIEQLESVPLPTGAPTFDPAAIARINVYLECIKGLAGIYVDIYYKQYPAAIMEVGTVFENTVVNSVLNHGQGLDIQLKAAKASVDAATTPETKQLAQQNVDAIQGRIDDLKIKQKWITLLTKYGNFIATVVKAQNSDDVQSAIEAVAMPAGSSSVKRNAVFNVALNAYIGPYIGGEKIAGFDKKAATTYGLTAPVGVALSWGNFIFKSMSITAFVPLIDLGAIASYRLGNTTAVAGSDTLKTTNIPDVKLKNIISPGFFLSIGLPNLPISISGGYQLAPTLRSITTVNPQNQVLDPNTSGLANQYASKLYSRWSFSIVVDIPILNFYTKGK